jgi:hypothetical protein
MAKHASECALITQKASSTCWTPFRCRLLKKSAAQTVLEVYKGECLRTRPLEVALGSALSWFGPVFVSLVPPWFGPKLFPNALNYSVS